MAKKIQGIKDRFGAECSCAVKDTSKLLDPELQHKNHQSSTNASFQSATLEGAALSLQLPIQDLSGTKEHLPLPYNASSQSASSVSDHSPSITMQGTYNSVPPVDPVDRSNSGPNDIVKATGDSDTASVASQYCGTEGDSDQPLSTEENNGNVIRKEKGVAIPLANDRPPRFPRRACIVYKDEQYSLDAKLSTLPRVMKYLVKVRTEISPGRFMAKLLLRYAR